MRNDASKFVYRNRSTLVPLLRGAGEPWHDVIGIEKRKGIGQTYCVYRSPFPIQTIRFPASAATSSSAISSGPTLLHRRTFKNECHCTPNTNGQVPFTKAFCKRIESLPPKHRQLPQSSSAISSRPTTSPDIQK